MALKCEGGLRNWHKVIILTLELTKSD